MSSAPAMRGSSLPHYRNRGKLQPPLSKMPGNHIKPPPERLPLNFYPRNIPTIHHTVTGAFPAIAKMVVRASNYLTFNLEAARDKLFYLLLPKRRAIP